MEPKRLLTAERKLSEILRYKVKLQELERDNNDRIQSIRQDLKEINFAERKREIIKVNRKIQKMRETLIEMI